MPFKTGLTFTYDCGEFEKNMDLALQHGRLRRLREAPRARRTSAASCAASACPTPSSAPRRRARKAPRCASTAAAAPRCIPARSRRARATRPRSSRLVCDQLGIDPERRALRAGRHRRGVLRRRHRRLALGAPWPARPSRWRPRRSSPRQADRRARAQGAGRRRQVRRRHVLVAQDQPDHDHQGGRGRRRRSGQDPARTWSRA